jgi:hypothetical protein
LLLNLPFCLHLQAVLQKEGGSIYFVAASMSVFVPISAEEKFKGVRREQ